MSELFSKMKQIWFFSVQEERLLSEWKNISKIGDKSKKEHDLLMELTQNSSCYGAAWFSAHIEVKRSRASLRNFGHGFAEIEVYTQIRD